jgi:hypothetical protein
MGPFDAIGLAVVCLAIVKIIQSVSQAFASRRDASRVSPDPAIFAEVDELRTRLAEVEERLDFAERLLAKADGADQLPGRVQR